MIMRIDCGKMAIVPALAASALRCVAQTNSEEATARREFLRSFVAAAIERTHHSVRYVPAYVKIPYPWRCACRYGGLHG